MERPGRGPARGLDVCPHRELLLEVRDRPRQMVHRTRAPRAAPLVRRLPDVDDAWRRVKPVAGPAVLTADDAEAERRCHERGGFGLLPLPDLRAVEAADLPLDRNRA